MGVAQKLFERMQRTKLGWGEADFDSLYRGFGFEAREGGSHRVYVHSQFRDIRATVSRHRSLPPGYAQDAVSNIRELQRRLAELEEEQSNDE